MHICAHLRVKQKSSWASLNKKWEMFFSMWTPSEPLGKSAQSPRKVLNETILSFCFIIPPLSPDWFLLLFFFSPQALLESKQNYLVCSVSLFVSPPLSVSIFSMHPHHCIRPSMRNSCLKKGDPCKLCRQTLHNLTTRVGLVINAQLQRWGQWVFHGDIANKRPKLRQEAFFKI